MGECRRLNMEEPLPHNMGASLHLSTAECQRLNMVGFQPHNTVGCQLLSMAVSLRHNTVASPPRNMAVYPVLREEECLLSRRSSTGATSRLGHILYGN